jgi:hypothetical protein
MFCCIFTVVEDIYSFSSAISVIMLLLLTFPMDIETAGNISNIDYHKLMRE